MSTSKASRLVTILAALSASAHGVAGELPLRSNALARYLAEMVHGFANVSLSPDGARACRVVLREDGTTAVEVFDWASGGRTRPLTATLAEDDLTACMWSSDSRLIVQVATWSLNSQTPRQLEAVNVDGSALKKLGWLDLLSFAPEEPELITVSTGWTFGVIDTVTGGGKLSKPSLSPAHHLITDGNGILRARALFALWRSMVRARADRSTVDAFPESRASSKPLVSRLRARSAVRAGRVRCVGAFALRGPSGQQFRAVRAERGRNDRGRLCASDARPDRPQDAREDTPRRRGRPLRRPTAPRLLRLARERGSSDGISLVRGARGRRARRGLGAAVLSAPRSR